MAPKRNSDSSPQSISPPPMKIAKTAGISLALTLGDGVSLALTKPVESLPKTASEFRNRLSDHGKEIVSALSRKVCLEHSRNSSVSHLTPTI